MSSAPPPPEQPPPEQLATQEEPPPPVQPPTDPPPPTPTSGEPLVPPTPTGSVGGLPAAVQFASLYVGDLHPEIGEATLYEAFSEAGNVASCRVCRDSVSRKSLGYGYVNYYSVADAERALETLNYMTFKGKPCRVMWSQRDPSWRKSSANNIFVKNLDPSIDNKALHDTFTAFGHILSCKVSMDGQGRSRGFGFVHYETEEEAKKAIEKVNGMQIGNSTVFVGPFIRREEKDPSGAETFTNLYVKHMPPSWDDAKVVSVFSEFGEVQSSIIMSADEGRRFALVNYTDPSSARAAIQALHRKDMRSEAGVDVGDGPAASSKTAEEGEKATGADASGGPEQPPKEGEAAAAEVEAGKTKGAAVANGQQGEKEKDEEEAGDVPDETRATAEEKARAWADEADHPAHLLYVQRALTRAERQAVLEEERKKRKGTGKGRPGVRICVRNLPDSMTQPQLREIFEKHGVVLHTILRTHEETGHSRGLGFVVMASMEEAQGAIAATNGMVVSEKALNVELSDRRRKNIDGDDGEQKGGKGKGRGKGKGGGRLSQLPPGVGPGGVPRVLPGVAPVYPGMALGPRPGYVMPPMGYAPFGPLSPALAMARPGFVQPATLAAAAAAAAAGRGGVPGVSPMIPGYPPPLRPPFVFPQMPVPAMNPWLAAAALRPQIPTVAVGQAPVGAPMPRPQGPITKEALTGLAPPVQKQVLGERLYQKIHRTKPDQAGKITGMMLELDVDEILVLLESEDKLKKKMQEAVKVLGKSQAAST